MHGFSASLKHVLNAFNLCLQVFEFVVLALVRSLELHYLGLQLFFFRSALNLPVFIDEATHGILLSDLFDLTGVLFDLLSAHIYLLSKIFASSVLIFEEVSVILHGLVLAVRLPELLECFGSVGQLVHGEGHICSHHFVNLAL